MTASIRPMAKQDKPALMQILRTTPEFKPAEVAVAEEVINSYLQQPSSYRISVAEMAAEDAGYICYGQTPLTESTWDIYWLVVAHGKQEQGIGGALLRSAEDDIQETGGRLIIIETSSQPGYEKTRRFYTDHGYELICRIADFYAPGDDKIILQKQLSKIEPV
ncbi:MAG: GNAT family N-acetyltransferase [Dehalococcoidales bacterium]|nr:GNAT family N-acetyltransferase [Dehalococcoidales bacterium]